MIASVFCKGHGLVGFIDLRVFRLSEASQGQNAFVVWLKSPSYDSFQTKFLKMILICSQCRYFVF